MKSSFHPFFSSFILPTSAFILGAYLLFFPGQKVNVLLGRSIVVMQSIIVIGVWFFLQFISGVGSLYSTQETGGVAYMAHIGGFLAGLAVAFGFRLTEGPLKS